MSHNLGSSVGLSYLSIPQQTGPLLEKAINFINLFLLFHLYDNVYL